jgi:hypothetical protein
MIVATQPSAVVLVRTREVICSISALRRIMSALASLRAINFTDRMAQKMMPVAQEAGREQRNLCSPPASRTNGNRLSNAFSRTFEPLPMN